MASKVSQPVRQMSSMSKLRERADLHDDGLLPISLGQKLKFISFSTIRHFRGHPFRLYSGERLEDMVESIRKNGILMPLLVRRITDDPDFDFEMLSGHNRMNAGQLAELDGALCVVKEHLSDAEAMMYVIETNLMQRSFSDLLPSEKAAVLTLRYSEMFSQGKRNDIIRELSDIEDATCGNRCHKSKSRDTVAEDYDMKGRMVAYYLRIHSLIAPLKQRIDNKEFSLVTASKLSYLSEQTQSHVEKLLDGGGHNANKLKIDALRKADGDDALDYEQVFQILTATDAVKSKLPTLKIKPKMYQRYFAADTTVAEMEDVIEKALALYFERD